MMHWGTTLDLILLAFYIAVLPPFAFVLVTSLTALLSGRRHAAFQRAGTSGLPIQRRFLFVIPAHDEETGIAETVGSCRAVNYPSHLLGVLVVADNCLDRTASIAHDAGAEVLERRDAVRTGKGHAIQYAIAWLRQSGKFDTLDALVVVDADSTVHPEVLGVFAQALERGYDWIQCYDCVGNADQSWRTRLVAYGFSLINGVTLLGQNAVGFSAALRGNGMCLSTRGLTRVPWTTHSLTEDLEYSWRVRIAGGRILFTRDASVYATMLVQGGRAWRDQRQRWECGRRELRRKMLGPLWRSTRLRTIEKVASLIELEMPTMASLTSIYFLLSIITFFRIRWIIANESLLLICLIGVCQTVATLAILIHAASPFLLSFLPWRFALSLVYLPYYIVWKLLWIRGWPTSWVRTPREARHHRDPTPGGMASFTPGARQQLPQGP
jgi:cellulose synthase/poly-beta-1,6-N-acetylglucosamine synthase-like glycosyltransferase